MLLYSETFECPTIEDNVIVTNIHGQGADIYRKVDAGSRQVMLRCDEHAMGMRLPSLMGVPQTELIIVGKSQDFTVELIERIELQWIMCKSLPGQLVKTAGDMSSATLYI